MTDTHLLEPQILKGGFKNFFLWFFPGALVVIPLIMLLYLASVHPREECNNMHACLKLINFNQPIFYLAALILSPLIGLILDSLGSLLEKALDLNNKTDEKIWERYLLSDSPASKRKIIFSHIDSIVLRYKIMLSLFWAFIFFLIEWIVIYNNDDIKMPCALFFSVLTITLLLILYTLWQSNFYCNLLNKLRCLLFKDTNNLINS